MFKPAISVNSETKRRQKARRAARQMEADLYGLSERRQPVSTASRPTLTERMPAALAAWAKATESD